MFLVGDKVLEIWEEERGHGESSSGRKWSLNFGYNFGYKEITHYISSEFLFCAVVNFHFFSTLSKACYIVALN